MSLIGSATAIAPQRLTPPGIHGIPAEEMAPTRTLTGGPAGVDFGNVLTGMLDHVEAKQAAAADTTRAVLMGDNAGLHQSMIAMQEASLSFNLMMEVRNKVVESYQELMRLPV